jgi:endonuclease/exonuclease/phosphatase family metal-dependent hydrolase
MRVMTYNIHGWRTSDGRPNLDAIAELIAEIGADVVGLNEVFYPRVVNSATAPTDTRPALVQLAERLQMFYLFGPCLRYPAQDDLPDDAYGNALLSRFPILAGAAHHLTHIEGKEQRGLLEARLQLPNGTPFTCYVTHLDHTSEAARLVQLRALRTWTVRDRNRPHLVMGDFNAISLWDFAGREEQLVGLSHHPKGSHLSGDEEGTQGTNGPQVVAQMEKAGYVDLYRRVGVPGQQTFIPETTFPIRIDSLFANAALAPTLHDCMIWHEAPGAEASDHRPVVADFAIDLGD